MRKILMFIFWFLSISTSVFAAGSSSDSSSSSTGGAESSYGGGGSEGPTAKTDPLLKAKRLISKERYTDVL